MAPSFAAHNAGNDCLGNAILFGKVVLALTVSDVPDSYGDDLIGA